MKKKKKAVLSNIIMMILAGGIGFLGGFLGLEKLDNEGGFISFIGLLIILILSMYIHIIIHEGGHLLFGLLSKYKFLSFRIGSLTLIKEETFKIKRYSIKGTAGQCLMEPPEYDEENFPYFLYNLGGGLINLIVSLIVILFIIFTKSEGILKESLYIFSAIGIFIALSNLIPLNIGGISNDGMNILSLSKSKEAKYSFYLQLKANALLMTGTRYRDMPLEFFNVPKDLDIKNPINLSRKILEGNYYQDKKDFYKAKEVYEEILKNEDILDLYRKEIICDFIFCELMTDLNEDKIKELYNKEIKTYVKQSKFMISKTRLSYAIESLINKNIDKSKKIKEEFNKLLKIYPYKGEILSEVELINLVDKKLEEINITGING